MRSARGAIRVPARPWRRWRSSKQVGPGPGPGPGPGMCREGGPTFRGHPVLKDTLEKRGALAQIKARIRAEVFNALDDQSEPRPTLSRENLLINELIREYLEYNKYKYTASVLTAESGQPEVPLDREFLARELNIVEDASAKSVPLLYGILSHFLHGGKEESTQNILPKVSLLTYPKQNLGKPPAERNQKDRIPEPGRMSGTSIEEPLILQSIKR
ncbi:centrosomal protein 20 isoform X2 [Poecile atricapillus]|uniref:centrosomal protein 20 isoform X2 n=1 Tax=Poecile atricapillus TaxID=48891 RepID=UPI002738A17D|nr:centrosomal protein 20 isoform X2 [Poecile atricapillus]